MTTSHFDYLGRTTEARDARVKRRMIARAVIDTLIAQGLKPGDLNDFIVELKIEANSRTKETWT